MSVSEPAEAAASLGGSPAYRAPQRAGSSKPLLSHAIAGHLNRTRLLQMLYDTGPSARSDLARMAQVTKTTIGSIVQPMIDEGILVEGEPRPSGVVGGKPARPLWFSPEGRPIVAVFLGPGVVRAALVSPVGTLLAQSAGTFAGDHATHDEILDDVVLTVERVLPPKGSPTPLGVGVAVAGMVDTDHGVIIDVNLAPRLAGLQLGPRLSEALGLSVHIDLHPRAQALGDRWFGDGRGIASFASLYIGEAIGAGFVTEGEVLRGIAGAGGEVGHTVVDFSGAMCRCGRRGCWETLATHRWLREQARVSDLPEAQLMTAERLVELCEQGSAAAAHLLDRYARHISIGLVNIQQTLAPGLFILHGDVVGGGEAFRDLIERHLRRGVAPRPESEPVIHFADAEDDITLLGAAGLVLSQSLSELA